MARLAHVFFIYVTLFSEGEGEGVEEEPGKQF